MDELQKSTRAIADKVSEFNGFAVMEIADYDFQVKCSGQSFLVVVSQHGSGGRKVEIYRGSYDDGFNKAVSREPLVSFTSDTDRSLGGAITGFLITI